MKILLAFDIILVYNKKMSESLKKLYIFRDSEYKYSCY